MPTKKDNTEENVARWNYRQAVIVAIIAGVFGTIGALIQLWAQKPATESKIREIFDRKLPIGTVVASILPPNQFAVVAGDDGRFNPATSAWVPADGREVPGSNYVDYAGSVVPDFRGLFLRGLNYSEERRVRTDGLQDPDGKGRKPGDYQPDIIKTHTHEARVPDSTANTKWGQVVAGDGAPLFHKPEETKGVTGPDNAGAESRPRNASVFYYIKIN